MQRRFWWLLVLLMLLLNAALWQRPSIARFLSNLAIRQATQDSVWAERLTTIARIVWRLTPEADLADARVARRNGDTDLFAKRLARARYFGVDVDRADREMLLSMAQGGQMATAGPKLADLVNSPAGDEVEISEAYAQGYIRIRNYQAALLLLEAWSKDFPSDSRPWAWLGQIHADLQANELAEAAYRKALKLNPNNYVAAHGLGTLLFDLKQPELAVPLFEVSKSKPSLVIESTISQVKCLRTLSRIDEANPIIAQLAEQFPKDYRVQTAFADALVEQGKYEQAEKALNPFISSGSLRRELRYTYAMALRGLGRTDEAQPHFDYAAESGKMIGEANRIAIQTKDEDKTVQMRYRLGTTFLKYGNFEDGLIWLNSILEIDPNNLETHRELAAYYGRHAPENPKFPSLSLKHLNAARAIQESTRK